MKIFFILIYFNIIILSFKIKTSIKKNKKYTTGNMLKLKTKYINNPKETKIKKIKLNKNIKEKILNYENNINFKIIDAFDEDPKSYNPKLNHYWFISSRRGSFFSFISIFFLLFFLIIYGLRLVYGIFGGFKTRLLPPSKLVKNFNNILIGLIFIMTFIFFLITFKQGYLIYDNIINTKKDANQSNEKINKLIQDSIKIIKEINNLKVKVLFSKLSFEIFNINLLLNNINNSFKIFYNSSKKFIDYFFGLKIYHILGEMIFNYVIILISVIVFYVAYYKKIVNLSLFLSFITLLNIIIYFNSYYSIFNYQSILTNICHKSVNFANDDNNMNYNVHKDLNTIVTGFNKNEKEIINKQMYNLLIAKQSVYIIIENLINYNIPLTFNEKFNNIYQLKNKRYRNKIKSFEEIELNKYIDLAIKIMKVYNKLKILNKSEIMIKFYNNFNKNICSKTLDYIYSFYYRYIYLLLILIWFWTSLYYSENTIKSLYIEKINLVKTKILRYDWN